MNDPGNSEAHGFSHALQPIVDINSHRVYSYEVLLRGLNDEPPESIFDNLARGTKAAFDQFSREQAFKMIAALPHAEQIQFNISPNAICLSNFKYVDQTIAVAQAQGLTPSQLIFEITEEEAIKDLDGLKAATQRVKEIGAQVAIDDFGSGHSGLSLLAELKPDIIKIDRSLITEIQHSDHKKAIVQAIYQACTNLGIEVIAEGVETQQEFLALKALNIKLYQGFYIAKPKLGAYPDVDFKQL